MKLFLIGFVAGIISLALFKAIRLRIKKQKDKEDYEHYKQSSSNKNELFDSEDFEDDDYL